MKKTVKLGLKTSVNFETKKKLNEKLVVENENVVEDNQDDNNNLVYTAELNSEEPSDLGVYNILSLFSTTKIKKKPVKRVFEKNISVEDFCNFSKDKSSLDIDNLNDVININMDKIQIINMNNNNYSPSKFVSTRNLNSSMLNSSRQQITQTRDQMNVSKKKVSTVTSKKVATTVQEDDELLSTKNSFIREENEANVKLSNTMSQTLKSYKENNKKYPMMIVKSLYSNYQKVCKEGLEEHRLASTYEDLIGQIEDLLGKNDSKLNKTKADFKSDAAYEYFIVESKNKGLKILSRIMSAVINKQNEENEETSSTVNFVKWKSKISELINIWDLFEANGISLKLSMKYIPLRNALIDRARRLQKGITIKTDSQDKEDIFGKLLLLGGGGNITEDKSKLPTAILLENDIIRILVDLLIALMLLYTLITFPLRFLMDGDSSNGEFFLIFEKFVDMVFFIDVICNFRTVYRDKSNNQITSIDTITSNYLKGGFLIDFICSMPWKTFFVWNTYAYERLKLVTLIRFSRIVKIMPLLNQLEQLQSANYTRLFKLLMIYFIIMHWMAIAIFLFIDQSIMYSEMEDNCYYSNNLKVKNQMNFDCSFLISFYNAAYIVSGSYTTDMNMITTLNYSNEYFVFIFEYLIGSIVSAYIFGGMTTIIQNLNQGQNFFTEKTDLIREHMIFYDIPEEIQTNIRCYYDYLWQRHKDVIYGKHHFGLLSRSLREKFERMNLPGNEIYLATFYSLGNPRLIDEILLSMQKYIVFPYEVLFAEGTLIYGVYVLLNGDAVLVSESNPNVPKEKFSIEFAQILNEINRTDTKQSQKVHKFTNGQSFHQIENSVIFPLVPAFLKTGRTYQKCYSEDFSDMLFIPLANFDKIITGFPIEMHLLKHQLVKYVEDQKLFENEKLFKMVSKHSARSIGSYFEKDYDKYSIWIPIPIPISQRKIAKNYIPFFLNKITSLQKEIIIKSDLNICFNSNKLINTIKNNNMQEVVKSVKEGGADIFTGDIFGSLRLIVKNAGELGSLLSKYRELIRYYVKEK